MTLPQKTPYSSSTGFADIAISFENQCVRQMYTVDVIIENATHSVS